MSDARLRELERRWKETNSPDDEAAYLLERVRVGDLTRERLELAAYCGNLAAAQATGIAPLPGLDWLRFLLESPTAQTLAACALCGRLERLWRASMSMCRPAEFALRSLRSHKQNESTSATPGPFDIAPGNTTYNPASTMADRTIAYAAANATILAVRALKAGLQMDDMTACLETLGSSGAVLLAETKQELARLVCAPGA